MLWHMDQVSNQLETHGFVLWNWDTGCDYYSGWIARSKDEAQLRDISKILNVSFFPWENLGSPTEEGSEKAHALNRIWDRLKSYYTKNARFRKVAQFLGLALALFTYNRLRQ